MLLEGGLWGLCWDLVAAPLFSNFPIYPALCQNSNRKSVLEKSDQVPHKVTKGKETQRPQKLVQALSMPVTLVLPFSLPRLPSPSLFSGFYCFELDGNGMFLETGVTSTDLYIKKHNSL